MVDFYYKKSRLWKCASWFRRDLPKLFSELKKLLPPHPRKIQLFAGSLARRTKHQTGRPTRAGPRSPPTFLSNLGIANPDLQPPRSIGVCSTRHPGLTEARFYGPSPYSHYGLRKVWLKHNLSSKGWNSDVHRDFPKKKNQAILVGTMLVGRLGVTVKSNVQRKSQGPNSAKKKPAKSTKFSEFHIHMND